MSTRPSTLPEWATDGGADITEPTLGEKQTGWVNNVAADGAFQNWWQNLVYDWTVYFDDAITNELIPIKDDFVEAEKDNAFYSVSLNTDVSTAGSVNDIKDVGPHYLLCYSATGIQTTKDFVSFSDSTVATSMNFRALAHDGAGVVLAVGSDADIQRSTDYGLSFSDVTPGVGTSTEYYSVHHDGTNFILGGENSDVGYSADGSSWTTATGTGSVAGNVYDFADDGSRIVAGKQSPGSALSTILYSDDNGVTWTEANNQLAIIFGVEYSSGLGLWVAGGNDLLQVSLDGETWTTVLAPANNLRAVAHYNNRFYFSAADGFVYFSMNGFEWLEVDTVVSSSTLSSAFAEEGRIVFGEIGDIVVALSFENKEEEAIEQANNNQYIPAINFIDDRDTTGVSNLRTYKPASNLDGLDELWVLPKTAGNVHVFGTQFTVSNSRSTSLSGNVNGVAWDGTQFIACCDDGITSAVDPDSTWTTRQAAGGSEDFLDVASDEVYNVAVSNDGANGKIYVSTPGTIGTWNLEHTATSDLLRAVATDGTSYCAVGDNGEIYSIDTDPTGTWTLRTTPGTENLTRVSASPDGVFIATGANQTVYRSDDACITWVDISAKFPGLSSSDPAISWDPHNERFVILDSAASTYRMWVSDKEGNVWSEKPTIVTSEDSHIGYGYSYGLYVETAGPELKTNLLS